MSEREVTRSRPRGTAATQPSGSDGVFVGQDRSNRQATAVNPTEQRQRQNCLANLKRHRQTDRQQTDRQTDREPRHKMQCNIALRRAASSRPYLRRACACEFLDAPGHRTGVIGALMYGTHKRQKDTEQANATTTTTTTTNERQRTNDNERQRQRLCLRLFDFVRSFVRLFVPVRSPRLASPAPPLHPQRIPWPLHRHRPD